MHSGNQPPTDRLAGVRSRSDYRGPQSSEGKDLGPEDTVETVGGETVGGSNEFDSSSEWLYIQSASGERLKLIDLTPDHISFAK